MLRSDHNHRRVVKPLLLQLAHKLPDRRIDELDLAKQRLGRCAGSVQISALHAVALLNQLLAYADCLEVHPKDRRNLGLLRTKVILSLDLVDDRIYLQRVVALNVIEAVRPGRKVRAGIANRLAGIAGRRLDVRQRNYVGVDLRCVEVVQRNRPNA